MKGKSKLFWFQVILGICSITPQTYGFLQGRIGGVTISFFLINAAFFLINRHVAREEGNREAFIIYSMWGFACLAYIALTLIAGLPWRESDLYATGSCVAFATLAVLYRKRKGEELFDPLTKGITSGFFAIVLHAQIILAMRADQSSAGLSGMMMLVAHISITSRLWQVREVRPLMISELARELSLVAATVAWWWYW